LPLACRAEGGRGLLSRAWAGPRRFAGPAAEELCHLCVVSYLARSDRAREPWAVFLALGCWVPAKVGGAGERELDRSRTGTCRRVCHGPNPPPGLPGRPPPPALAPRNDCTPGRASRPARAARAPVAQSRPQPGQLASSPAAAWPVTVHGRPLRVARGPPPADPPLLTSPGTAGQKTDVRPAVVPGLAHRGRAPAGPGPPARSPAPGPRPSSCLPRPPGRAACGAGTAAPRPLAPAPPVRPARPAPPPAPARPGPARSDLGPAVRAADPGRLRGRTAQPPIPGWGAQLFPESSWSGPD
jgi:hypothetical protein